MRAFTGEFNLTKLERVVSGAGSIDSLGEELQRRNLSRAKVVDRPITREEMRGLLHQAY
jgi:hypothetical protein